MSERIAEAFAKAKEEHRAALVTFTMVGDPAESAALDILHTLVDAGADVLELGMPFSDPMADGPVIQAAAARALQAGADLNMVLRTVDAFRHRNTATPIILMGYLNPILHYGAETFCQDAAQAGIDGVLIVDMPPEEESILLPFLEEYGIANIRLVAPTTDDVRLQQGVKHAKGFVYYVAVAGVTGTRSGTSETVAAAVARIKRYTDLPVVTGFGIKTAEDVAAFAPHTDGVVVGSALVDVIHQQRHNQIAIADYVTALAAAGTQP